MGQIGPDESDGTPDSLPSQAVPSVSFVLTTGAAEPAATPNPFAVSAVRPGALPYLFLDDMAVEELVGWLEDDGWKGQIIGPHGSGKSTLLASLIPHLEAAGRRVLLYTLRDGQRTLPEELRAAPQDNQPTIAVIDGYEQLSRFSCLCLRLICRLRGWGLLITSHRDMGLPTLWETTVDSDLAVLIIKRLLKNQWPEFTVEQIETSLAYHGGNLRDVLFEFYDEYERRRRSAM